MISDPAPTCGVWFVRLSDGKRVPCILLAGHECGHAFGKDATPATDSKGPQNATSEE